MFKTLELEGTDAWSASLESDLHLGEINKDYFVQKEGVWFANVRRLNEQGSNYDLSQISAQGIGEYTTFTVLCCNRNVIDTQKSYIFERLLCQACQKLILMLFFISL